MRLNSITSRTHFVILLLIIQKLSSAQYCLPPSELGTILGSYINSVELLDLSNQSGTSIAPYYLYYSNLEPVELEAGNDYIMSIGAGSMQNDYFAVWVDWNNDLDFADEGELIGEQTNSIAGQTLFFTLNVPLNTATSFKRMRIRCGPNVNLEPCLNYSYGETEDYTLLIQPPPLNYCIPSSFAGGGSGNFIQAIRLNDFVNSTGASVQPHYFVADTLLKPKLTRGSSQILRVMGGTSAINRYAAWIDWNNDGDYVDAGENIGDEANTQAYQQHGFYFTVPNDADEGMLRMRVRCAEVFSGNLSPCANYANGETEDYIIEIIDSISGYCTPQFSAGNSSNTFLNRITLDNLFFDLFSAPAPDYYSNYSNSFNSAPLSANETYMLYLGAQGDAFASTRYAAWIDYNRDGDFNDELEYLGETRMNSAFASSFISFQTPAIYEAGRTRLRVLVAPNGSSALQSCGVYTFGECKDFAVELQQFSAGLCVPTGNTEQGDFINKIEIGDLQSDEGSQGGSDYRYYGNWVHQTTPGTQIQLQVQGGSFIQLPVQYGIWADWNNDLFFDELERVGLDTVSETEFPNLQFNIDVPQIQAQGFVHLRIRAIRNSVGDTTAFSACSDHAFGETEDYRLYIGSSANSFCTNLHTNNGSNTISIDEIRLVNSDLHKNASGVEDLTDLGYTRWPISGRLSTTLVQPQTYYLKVQTSGADRAGAWLDMNQNQTFETNEFYPIYIVTENLYYFQISIPPSTPSGFATLRIRVRNGGAVMSADEACSVFENGETEDFRLFISTARGLPPFADFDYSLNGIETSYTSTSANFPDFWTWFFEGGNPPTTIGDNALVYYTNGQPGCLSASITATNFYGSDSYVNPCAIYIPETNACQSLMFSEYVCDTNQNQAIELVNASSQVINLENWAIALYPNGTFNPTQTLDLSGSLEPYQTLVIVNPSADSALQSLSSNASGVCNFDGNDVVVLLKNGSIVDAIGMLGESPANGWPVGGLNTQSISMLRDITVSRPNPNWDDSQFDWIAYAAGTFNNLGSHTFNCGTYSEPSILNAGFSLSDTLICAGDFIVLNDESAGNPVNWIWTFPGSVNEYGNGANPGVVYYLNSGTFSIGLAISNELGFDAELVEQAITVLDYPNPQIELQGNALICSGCAEDIIWMLNGSELIGETGTALQISEPGEYSVTSTNAAGCVATSPMFLVFTVHTNSYEAAKLVVYPNPTNGMLNIKIPDTAGNEISYDVIDMVGRLIQRGKMQPTLSIESLNAGNYFIRVWDAGRLLGVKHIVKR
jgi:PKD repeat protein